MTLWSKPSQSEGPKEPKAEPLSEAQAKVRHPGKRFAQIVKLKPEYVDKYKEVHAKVWPEVLSIIKQCNIKDCKLD